LAIVLRSFPRRSEICSWVPLVTSMRCWYAWASSMGFRGSRWMFFNEGEFEHAVVGHVPDHRRHLEQSGALRRGQSSLPCDEFVSAAGGADQDGLENSILANGRRQLFQVRLVDLEPRLARVRDDPIDVDFVRPDFLFLLLSRFWNQRFQTSTECPFFMVEYFLGKPDITLGAF